MELRTQAVDRLIDSIAPSLAAELERVAAEVRQQLELESHEKLQSALRDAELETLHLAEVRLEEAVLRTREEVRIQLTEEFDAQLHIAIEQTRNETRNEMNLKADEAMKAAFANWTAERAELQEQLSLWHVYAEGQRTLSECTSQPEILAQFLKLSEPFADSLAIYIAKADGLALWRKRGSGEFAELISADAVDPDLYFKPAVVLDKTVAAVSAIRPCRSEALNFLMSCFEHAIESFGLKLQKPANV